jgi:hypothetical protein
MIATHILLLACRMPTFSTWHCQERGAIFSVIPNEETVQAIVWVPPLTLYNAEPVRVNMYSARWLALLALDRLTHAELELETLIFAAAAPEALTPAELGQKSEIYSRWVLAVFELVLLYRLHLELEERALRRRQDWEGKLFGVGAVAREHSLDLLHKIDRRLHVHQSTDATVAGSGLDPLVEGTFSDCAGVLDHFLKTACKINVARNPALHIDWLASIRILAEEVLQFMADQVHCSTGFSQPFC